MRQKEKICIQFRMVGGGKDSLHVPGPMIVLESLSQNMHKWEYEF